MEKMVECGEDLILRIQESSFGADCYDFELTITSEGGGSVVVQKDELIPTRQYNTSDNNYIYTYEFSNVQSNTTAELIYTRVNATVITSVSPYGGGTIQPGGAVTVLCGSHQTFQITPGENHRISVMDDVIIDPESGIGLYNLRNIQSSYAMEVTVVKNIALSGDVNGDCEVNSIDAMLALQIIVGQMTPTAEQKEAADMDEDGEVAANDVLAILREAIGSAAPGVYTAGSSDRQINIALADARGVAGESVIMPVRVERGCQPVVMDDIGPVAGGDISIAYDSSVLQAVDVSSDAGELLAANVTEPGIVRIAFADTNSLSGKTLANIRFHILTDHVSELAFRKADLYGPDALPLDAKGIDGRFESWGIPPERSALLQNFPNPSNPDTWIPYQLKEDGQVAIQIFSVQGELVRDLNLGYRSAGSYISQDRAAHWDGRNASGEEAASDTYFYSLRSSHFFIVRKLTILR